MKKLLVLLFVVTCFLAWPLGAFAYTINDLSDDSISANGEFESYGINVNWGMAIDDHLSFEIFTDYDGAETVGAWDTEYADLFITETYQGSDYLWAIPLVTHGSFNAGTMYAVGSYLTSDDLVPGSGYTYNESEMVRISSVGSNYDIEDMVTEWGLAGSVAQNNNTSGESLYTISVDSGIWLDGDTTALNIHWATATCANDVVSGTVPEPATMLLLGTGLVGLAGFGRKKFFKK